MIYLLATFAFTTLHFVHTNMVHKVYYLDVSTGNQRSCPPRPLSHSPMGIFLYFSILFIKIKNNLSVFKYFVGGGQQVYRYLTFKKELFSIYLVAMYYICATSNLGHMI